MARYEFRLPDIGEGIAEAEIVAWHIKVGDEVAEDQQLADMMTDKATVELENPVAGKVVQLAGEVGDQIPIGSTLVVFETADGADNRDSAVTQGIHLIQAARLKTRRHQKNVRARFDLMSQTFVVANINSDLIRRGILQSLKKIFRLARARTKRNKIRASR